MDGEDEASALLLELAQALHLVAVPADLLEERLRAAAAGLGLSAEVFTLQSLVMVELQAGTGPRRLEMRRIPFDPHWNLRRIADTVELTRAVAERRVGAAAARAELARITARPNRYPKWLVVLGYGAYGAATATRVGGGWREMVPAVLIGFLAGWIHFGTLRSDKVDLLKSFLAALAGTFAGFALGFALPPFDAGKAVFGGVTLLVPAMVIAIGMHELASEALESGVPRLAYGLLRFLMLGFGIGAALAIATAIAPMPAHPAAAGLPPALKLAVVAAGGLALVVCLQGRPRDVPWIIAAVVLAYGVQELTKLAVGSRGSPFVAALVLGAAAYLQARIPGHLAATMIIPGLLQLVPGFLGAQATVGQLTHGASGQGSTYFQVLLVSLQIGIGLLVAGLIFIPRRSRASGHG